MNSIRDTDTFGGGYMAYGCDRISEVAGMVMGASVV